MGAALVSQVAAELKPLIGTDDPTVAEFIISLRTTSKSREEFKKKLAENDAVFPDDVLRRLDKLIVGPEKSVKVENSGLSIPDNIDHVRKLEKMVSSITPPWKEEKQDRGRKRRRSDAKEKILYDRPEFGVIYDARISSIKNFGAFAVLEGFKNRVSGLIHVSQLVDGTRVNDPSDIVHVGEIVKVKIRDIQGDRISLSMKDAQDDTRGNAFSYDSTKQKRRATSQERFEMRQLVAAGVNRLEDFPELMNEDEESGHEEEEDVDIEVREETAPFLKGETRKRVELSPIRIVRAPQGSMNRSAADSARELGQWRDEKRAKEKELAEAKKRADVVEEAPTAPMVTFNKTAAQVHRSAQTIMEQRRTLPVYQQKEKILKMIRENQIVVIVGHTGSGKTTQITQFLDDDGYTKSGIVGCTQPRRMAAVSVAQRVAEEYGCRLGDEVGYNVRFDDKTSHKTKIKYMTDGMLQREALSDRLLRNYSVVVLDEAHERTISTDVLFALLKKAAVERPELKIVVTSATLNAEKFSKYFLDCPIMEIAGKLFPVVISYLQKPVMNYLDAALKTVVDIHLTEPAGDILVFLTGRDEIESCCERVTAQIKSYGNDVPELIALPVFSQMPNDLQARIFEPAPDGARKVIFATNIAETSLTIDGIYFVIDPGFVKVNAYDPKYGMEKLVVTPISQAQANQRTGRAGRVGPGKCFRLYTEDAFHNEMLPNPIPEILRENLSHTLLMLRAMGFNQLEEFEFMDSPPRDAMTQALEQLYQLGALDESGLITLLGQRMANFPMEPALAKVLINSADSGCSEEMLTIVAMLSVQNVFFRPSDKSKQREAENQKSKFHDPFGDHLTLLNVYNGWIKSGMNKIWCQRSYIHDRTLLKAKHVREQLIRLMRHARLRIVSGGNNAELVRKTICSGYFYNSAKRDPQEGYKTLLEGTPVYLHPASAVFFRPPTYVVYHTLLLTTKEYMSYVTSIEPKWLPEVAPTFFNVAQGNGLSKRRRQERIEPRFQPKGADKNEWRISAQRMIPPR